MVKFRKQLGRQIVPEWREGYCDYKQLKKDVKRIKEHHELVNHDVKMSVERMSKSSMDTLKSLGSPLVAFSDKLVNSLWEKVDNITVHIRQLRQSGADEELYETELLDSALTPMELALEFFKRLDAELNRVNRFYKLKEEEYNLHAHSLELQIAALLDLRKALSRSDGEVSSSDEEKSDSSVDAWRTESGRQAGVNNKQVQYAEKLLRTAFAEFYRGLGLLKSYSAINIMAFSKILKKYDKVTGWNASLTYVRVVESSYFATSDKVVKLMDRIEDNFTLHLAKKNHREAMIYLRPIQQNSSNSVMYFQGVFTGCSVAFLSILALSMVIPSRWESDADTGRESLKRVFPISSTMGLVLLHLYMYGWNVYLWRRARINYSLIFEWAPGTELQHQDVLLLSTGLTTLWMLAMIVVKLFPALPHVDLIPVSIFLLLLFILFLPLDLCFRSMRAVFLRCMIHVICSPFYKVVLADFFLADQLTSQVTALKNIQYLACYYIGCFFNSNDEKACSGTTFHYVQYMGAILPSWWRLMQCARRWKDERDVQQVLNGGKYLSALIAAALKVAYVQQETTIWLLAYVASSFISSCFGCYWDIVRDWGLMQSNSVNPWLRDHLLLKYRPVYYVSMLLNIILRMTWLFAVVLEEAFGLNRSTADLVLAVLEVVRRGHWNFYRLENEHLHNFGELKAFKQMPLPFQDVERR